MGTQSTVFFGSLSVVWIILDVVGSLAPLGAIGVINTLLWLFGIVMWIICMVKAWTGGGARFPIPLVGGVVTPYAEQLAGSVN